MRHYSSRHKPPGKDEMANMILNGDFSKQGLDWTIAHEDRVNFKDGYCVIGRIGSVSQVISAQGAGGKEFMLSARTKTIPDCVARVELSFRPQGPQIWLDAGLGQDWTVYSNKFIAPEGTEQFIVKLFNPDAYDHMGSFYGDVTLVELPPIGEIQP
jgi:hypothetical protein